MQLPYAGLDHPPYVLVKHPNWNAEKNASADTPRDAFDNTPSNPPLHTAGHPTCHTHSDVKDGLQPRRVPQPVSHLHASRGRRSSSKETLCPGSRDILLLLQQTGVFRCFLKQIFIHSQVDEGSTAELKCFISCAPLTTTTWEKDGVPLLSNNLISLSEKTGPLVLVIPNSLP